MVEFLRFRRPACGRGKIQIFEDGMWKDCENFHKDMPRKRIVCLAACVSFSGFADLRSAQPTGGSAARLIFICYRIFLFCKIFFPVKISHFGIFFQEKNSMFGRNCARFSISKLSSGRKSSICVFYRVGFLRMGGRIFFSF